MQPTRARRLCLAVACLAAGLGAAQAPPSYHGVARVMDRVEAAWKGLPPEQNPHAAGWLERFATLRSELRRYSESPDPEQRVAALKRLYGLSGALQSSGWPVARELNEELRAWLRPRVALAWAEYRVLEAVQALPESESENRTKWTSFLNDVLRPSIQQFEGAGTVANRLAARERLDAALRALQRGNQSWPWSRALALQSAVADLYSLPNFEATLDASVLASALPSGIVDPGWIYFRGQWSYVTPGPITGIGFVPTADGIQFAISQALTSTTPIQGFQQQVASDRQGRRAARLYHFDATSQNNAILTMTVLFRLTTGLQLAPGYQHGISATVGSSPQPGRGLGRLIASLVGYNQRRITNEVYEGAIGQIREGIVSGSSELAGIRASERAAQINAQVRPYIVDARTAGVNNFGVTDLRMATHGHFARIQGNVVSFGDPDQAVATFPQPRTFSTLGSGITVDVHLPAALANVARGLLRTPEAQGVTNVMIVTNAKLSDSDAPGFRTAPNTDFGTYLAEVRRAREANNPEVQAIRVFKPERPLEAAADKDGNLVLVVPDFTIDVPAPPQAVRGGALTGPPAQVYRLKAARAEFTLAVHLEPAAAGQPPRLVGQVVGFDGGPNVQILAINESEEAARPLNALTSRVVAVAFGNQLAGLPLNLPLDRLATGQVALVDASPLDPSGWMRLVFQTR